MKKTQYKNTDTSASVRKYVIVVAIVWTAVVAMSLGWSIHSEYINATKQVMNRADEAFDKDIVYRKWVAGHGGVYVPVTDETPVNPYLDHLKERDIKTPSGRKLTLVNPAYMTRQVFELGKEKFGIRGHITSLNPIRPENAPDAWEKKTLETFNLGNEEVYSIEDIDSEPYMRLMRPFVTEQRCLKCHAKQGYKIGDIRGGLSISVAMKPHWAAMTNHLAGDSIGHFVIWLFGLFGIVIGGHNINLSISKAKQARDALCKTNEKLNISIDNMPNIYILCGTDMRVLEWNRTAEKIFGYSKKEVSGKEVVDFIVPEEVRHMVGEALKKLKVGEVADYSEKDNNIRKDGKLITCQWFNTPLVDTNGKVFAILLMAQDITERILAEEEIHAKNQQIRASNQQLLASEQQLRASNQHLLANEQEREKLVKTLEYKNNELQDIVYTTSHDLRSPLVNIEGFSGELHTDCDRLLKMLADQDDGEGKRQQIEVLLKESIPESLGFISGSAQKMASLLNGLLQISRVGTIEITSETVDMNKAMGETLAAMEHQIKENNIIVTVETLADCVGDPNMLDHIFSNLIGNAIKYRDPAKRGEIKISGRVEGGMSIYCVEDNGIGIDPGYQNKVFEIFHRLNPDKDVEGEGLGLTIAKRTLDRLGGKIWLESEPDKGSKFFIALPNV
jgi:PAS domain S-box-containing protein